MEQATRDMLTETLGKAITDVCSMMLGETVAVGAPDPAQGLPHRTGGGVRGTIDITGDLSGEATIHLPTETAVNLVAAFTGDRIAPDDAAFTDAIGELANMVVGSAKAHFEGLKCSISVPTVSLVAAAGEQDRGPSGGGARRPDLVLPVTGQSGDFAIEVLLAT